MKVRNTPAGKLSAASMNLGLVTTERGALFPPATPASERQNCGQSLSSRQCSTLTREGGRMGFQSRSFIHWSHDFGHLFLWDSVYSSEKIGIIID